MSRETVLITELPVKTKDFVSLVRAVDSDHPTQNDIDALQQYFESNPDTADAMGNLVHLAQGNLIRVSFTAPSMRQAIIAKCRQMRDDMGYSKAGAVERALIEHVVLCWLRLYDCELRYHSMMQSNPTMQQGKYWEQKLSANQRRFTRAVESLERTRKLMHRAESSAVTMLLKEQIKGW